MNEKFAAIHKAPLSLRTLPSVRQLRAFVAVYQNGNVSAAAEVLSVTQPAVTVLLREMEERLGVKLFDRTTRTLKRTEAAEEAYEYARKALAELEKLGAAMSDFAGSRRGRLRIAATSTVVQTVLPAILQAFTHRFPEISVMIDDCAPGEFVERIASERVDCGVGTLETSIPGLEEHVFLTDPIVAAALPSVFPTTKGITWTELAQHPVITVKAGYGVRRRLEQAALMGGAELRVSQELALFTTAVALASGGLGVALVPQSVVSAAPSLGLVVRRLIDPGLDKPTAFIFKQDRTLPPSAQELMHLLQAHYAQHAAS